MYERVLEKYLWKYSLKEDIFLYIRKLKLKIIIKKNLKFGKTKNRKFLKI